MTDAPDSPGGCSFCGTRISGEPVANTDGATYCSAGCRRVDAALPELDERAPETGSSPGIEQATQRGEGWEGGETADSSGGAVGAVGGGVVDAGGVGEAGGSVEDAEVFLQVDGMHSVTCETFLESVATNTEGVRDAEASYITETIRITYDSSQCSVDDLRTALDVLGYAPRLRADAETRGARPTQRGGPGRRSVDELLSLRYVAGVVFASFLMLPYVALFYPAHLATLGGGTVFGQFAGLAAFTGTDLMVVLPLFMGLTAIIILFTGAPLLRGAYIGVKLRQPNTELLVTVTILSGYLLSVVNALRGSSHLYFDLVIVVAAGVVGVAYYETDVKRRAVSALTDLTISTVEEVRVIDDEGGTQLVDRGDLSPSARVLVREGERVPVDGELLDGECSVDESIRTGEARPVLKTVGDSLVGGSIVTSGWAVLDPEVAGTSSRERLRESVWSLQSATHGIHRQANRFAIHAMPVVVALALIGILYAWGSGSPPIGVVAAGLVVLVVVTPWALGVSTPLSVGAGIEAALQRGIVVFDDTVFERLRNVETVVFDKTGTLTTGEMIVHDADAPSRLLAIAGRLEQRTSHPIADAITNAFGPGSSAGNHGPAEWGAMVADEQVGEVASFTSHPLGVEGVVDGERVLVGHPKLFNDNGWQLPESVQELIDRDRAEGRVPVVVGRDGAAEGVISVSDAPREGWSETVDGLEAAGLEVVVLTGDEGAATRRFGEHPGVSRVFAGVSPDGKTATIERLQQRGRVAMVGDGTNDAPALTRADLGIVLGSGTALAAEAADVALADDDLAGIDAVFDLATVVKRRVQQNNALAFSYNVLLLPLALVGWLNPLLVMLAVLVTGGLLAANSFRSHE